MRNYDVFAHGSAGYANRTNEYHSRVLPFIPRSLLGLWLFLFSVWLFGCPRPGEAQDIRLENQPVLITGPLQVRLAFTDQNGAPQDIPLQQLPSTAFASLPQPLQQAKGSVLLQGQASTFFDQLWAKTQGQVCGEIFAEIVADVNTNSNMAYNVNCTTNPHGALTALIQTSWVDQYLNSVTGKRLVLDYWIPYNAAVFSVTSPCTCKQSNAVCAADPQFTLAFEVHLLATFTSNDVTLMSLPFTNSPAGTIDVDAVTAGDIGQAVAAATDQWGVSLAAGTAASAATLSPVGELADLLSSTGEFVAQLGGIGVAAVCNQHLRDSVSVDLSLLSSSTSNSDAAAVTQQFGSLFQDLMAGEPAGFTQFDIVGSADGSLIFRWTAPPGKKSVLFNVDANSSTTPTFFSPTIGTLQTEVAAGNHLTVEGNYFAGAYTTHLKIGWNDTVPGQPRTANVDWEQQGGSVQHATSTQGFFEADGLKPGTAYQFRVSDCTPITCTPWSDWFSAATQAQGSDQVVLSLDGPAPVIGTATLAGDGTFTADVTIPQGAIPGQHTIYATVGSQGALFPIGGKLVRITPTLLSTTPVTRSLSAVGPARVPLTSRLSALTPVLPVVIESPIVGKVVTVPAEGMQQAKTPVLVCAPTGCTPSIAEVNQFTNTPYSGGAGIYVSTFSFTLQGEDFAPNQGITLYLDGPTGQTVGAANVNSVGTFEAQFTMPNVSGQHELTAVQNANGHTLQAQLSIFVQAIAQ